MDNIDAKKTHVRVTYGCNSHLILNASLVLNVQTWEEERQRAFFQQQVERLGHSGQVVKVEWYNPEIIQPWEFELHYSDPDYNDWFWK